jgi:2'-5' RNA ligase
VRFFVALDIPSEVQRAIAEFVAKLQAATGRRAGIRWAHVAGMHVTLKFIGEAPAERVEKIKASLGEARSAQAVEMKFRGTGFFPNARHPRVFWAGIEASENLAELAAGIEQRLEKLGIAREERAFKPHLTLARFKSEDGLAELREALAKLDAADFGATRTGELHLYQSALKPGGAEYTKLATFAFAGQA